MKNTNVIQGIAIIALLLAIILGGIDVSMGGQLIFLIGSTLLGGLSAVMFFKLKNHALAMMVFVATFVWLITSLAVFFLTCSC